MQLNTFDIHIRKLQKNKNNYSPNKVTFLFYLGHSNHHQDLMDNFYWMMEIVFFVDLNQHHIAKILVLKIKSINNTLI